MLTRNPARSMNIGRRWRGCCQQGRRFIPLPPVAGIAPLLFKPVQFVAGLAGRTTTFALTIMCYYSDRSSANCGDRDGLVGDAHDREMPDAMPARSFGTTLTESASIKRHGRPLPISSIGRIIGPPSPAPCTGCII
ncbi:hypothetical protein [Xaviernesmea oryzae]|uniref:hypothetical protein n=1 Tax=Xaviernesmea oryzae TaxID=464029 RepID=UPI0013565AAB